MNQNTVDKLAKFVNAGKNATVLTQVAKAMQDGKALPAWAREYTKDSFIKIFKMPEAKLLKILKDDSWYDFRKVINAYKSGKMDAKLVETAKTLLLIPTFATSQTLKLAAAWVESTKPTIADIDSPIETVETAETAETVETAETAETATIESVLALFNQLSLADQTILLDTLNAQSLNTQKAA